MRGADAGTDAGAGGALPHDGAGSGFMLARDLTSDRHLESRLDWVAVSCATEQHWLGSNNPRLACRRCGCPFVAEGASEWCAARPDLGLWLRTADRADAIHE